MFQERNRLLVKHEQLRAKKRERKKKHKRSKERGLGGQEEHPGGQACSSHRHCLHPGGAGGESSEKEKGHRVTGRRRHRDKEKGTHTIRGDSASPRTRIHKVGIMIT